eukprot:m.277065 g.277065  ORF g.277065 m.277065 type:complete len:84 (-) comp16145_c0_seq26:28-279(-)
MHCRKYILAGAMSVVRDSFFASIDGVRSSCFKKFTDSNESSAVWTMCTLLPGAYAIISPSTAAARCKREYHKLSEKNIEYIAN